MMKQVCCKLREKPVLRSSKIVTDKFQNVPKMVHMVLLHILLATAAAACRSRANDLSYRSEIDSLQESPPLATGDRCKEHPSIRRGVQDFIATTPIAYPDAIIPRRLSLRRLIRFLSGSFSLFVFQSFHSLNSSQIFLGLER